jgi:ankyrin repeat protein
VKTSARKSNVRTTVLLRAVEAGDTARLSKALHGAKVDRPIWGGLSALAYATHTNRFAVAKTLIALGADVNCGRNGHTPLLIAAGRGDLILVDALLQAGANPNAVIQKSEGDYKSGFSPLMAAAEAGSKIVVRRLVASGASINAETSGGLSAVGYAILAGRKELAKDLLRLGAKVGSWSLLKAVADKDLPLVRLLLVHGAAADWPADQMWGWVHKGETPLGLAVRSNAGPIARTLLHAGANLNLLSAGRMPLDWAAYHGFEKVAGELLKRGADPNLANRFGTTPLMAAAAEGHAPVVQLLLGAGADKSKRLFTGETALELARAKGYQEIERLLCK